MSACFVCAGAAGVGGYDNDPINLSLVATFYKVDFRVSGDVTHWMIEFLFAHPERGSQSWGFSTARHRDRVLRWLHSQFCQMPC
jgi:hypothetical protein